MVTSLLWRSPKLISPKQNDLDHIRQQDWTYQPSDDILSGSPQIAIQKKGHLKGIQDKKRANCQLTSLLKNSSCSENRENEKDIAGLTG